MGKGRQTMRLYGNAVSTCPSIPPSAPSPHAVDLLSGEKFPASTWSSSSAACAAVRAAAFAAACATTSASAGLSLVTTARACVRTEPDETPGTHSWAKASADVGVVVAADDEAADAEAADAEVADAEAADAEARENLVGAPGIL